MTDTSTPRPERERPSGAARSRARQTLGSRPGFWPTAALAAAGFLLLFELLAFQLRHGSDPALGGAAQPAGVSPQRPVLVRRVVKTRVVADVGTDLATTPAASSGSASTSSPAPTATTAPAPTPAPAPAAPVVSSSS